MKNYSRVYLFLKTLHDGTLKMVWNIREQQIIDLKSVSRFSLDEDIDVTGSDRLVIFLRYITGDYINEELIHLVYLKIKTKGVNTCKAVLKSLPFKEIDLYNVSTGGEPNMIDEESGFVNLFKKYVCHSVLGSMCTHWCSIIWWYY